MYNSVIQFPPSQGGSGRVSPLFLTGHIAKIQNRAPGCQEASPFWRRFNTSRACHSECSEESEYASKKYYIADVYRFFGPLRMTRNGSSCLLAIFVPFNNCKIGVCKDNSYWGGFSLGFIVWFKFASSTPALLILAKVESQLSQITDNS